MGNAPPGTPHFTFPDYRTRWRWLPDQRLRSTPGTAALYSNVAFDYLSDAFQAATHKQYAALLAERPLNPLHMRHTTFFPGEEQCGHLLIGARDEGACAVTEATAGSSGLYSTADDMAIWLQYLLHSGGSETLSQGQPAQAVYVHPSDLIRQKGIDHAGEPTGIGLGWIHILPVDSPSHIIEKTGGALVSKPTLLSTNISASRSFWPLQKALSTPTLTSSMPPTNSCSRWPVCRRFRLHHPSQHANLPTHIVVAKSKN